MPADLALTLAWPALTRAARVPRARGAAVGARPRLARDHARPGVAAAPGRDGGDDRPARRARGPRRRADAPALPRPADLGPRRRRRCRGRARDPRRRPRDRVRAAPPRPPRPHAHARRAGRRRLPRRPALADPHRGARHRRRPPRPRRDDRRRAARRRPALVGDRHDRARGRDDRHHPRRVAVARADPARPRPSFDNPVASALALLATTGPERLPRPARTLATAEDAAPSSMEAFARVGGDRNPLHRSVLAARMAGLSRPIAHGAWTAARASAFVVDALCGGDATLLREWRVTFLAPVALGAILDFEATRVAVVGGRRVIQVRVRAGETDVALGEAIVDPLPTAFVFPGQGIQRRGLGAEGRARSRAARATWERAAAHTSAALGFDLLEVVERNPRELRLGDGRVVRHPSGVLFRTEFTQPALVALAAAQLAELRAEGAVGDDITAAGHSVGEFSALHALGALTLEDALTPRAPPRRSDAGARPARRGRHVALPARGRRPRRGRHRRRFSRTTPSRSSITTRPVASTPSPGPPTRSPRSSSASASARCGCCPGSTSRSTRPCSLPPSRRSASTCEAVELDAERLVGRWVPNLTGRPFTRDDDAVDLLARQLASPVRWIDVQHALRGRRLIEVAPRARGRAHRPRPDHARRGRRAAAQRTRPRRRARPRHRRRGVRAEVSAPVAVPTGADTSARTRRLHPIGPSMPGMRWNSCSRCRRGCGSTSSTRRRRSTSSSRACRRVATRS